MAIPFLNNIIIDDAGHIQFKTAAGANAGKIDQDGNNLVLTNAVGDILLGDGSSDVYIGDGTNNVDIIFEQSGAIKGDGSAVTLTLGGANTTLNLENPNFNGNIGMSSKLTFTTANGFILFDYEPSGDTGEYTTEVPLIKVDRSGEESTILARISEYRGIALGIDDTTWIRAGDTSGVVRSNVNLAEEVVLMSAESGFRAIGFPGNDTTWSNRNEFLFYSQSTTAANNGLYIGDGGSTQFIDLSRNLKNIGTISSGAITSTGKIQGTELEGTSLDINGTSDVSGNAVFHGKTGFGAATTTYNVHAIGTGWAGSGVAIESTTTNGAVLSLFNTQRQFQIASRGNTLDFRDITDSDTVRFIVNSSGHLLPGQDSTYNLGSSGTRWSNIYADTLYGDASNLTNVPAPSNMVTTDTTQTISGAKNFTNVSNQFNGHVYFNAYDANGNHYPHFRDGSNSNGANINIRQYYGSANYKTHVMSSDSSGNMQFDFQGTLKGDALTIDGAVDINGNADISGTLTSGKHVINTGSDDILTLNQTSTDNKWNYINFNNQGTREWFIGQDSSGNFDLYNDNIDAYAITVGYTNNAIGLNGNVSVTGNLAATGTVTGSNLSGTNTGDQDLSGYVTLAGAQTITGNKTFSVQPTFNADTLHNGHIYGRAVDGESSRLYRFGGLWLTWDSDSYGTNFNHSITSTDNGTYSDSITINSYDKVRINIDSNNNDSASTFSVGKHGTGTTGTLLTLEEDGDLTVTGALSGSNFSGSSSGTNTGDQDLSGLMPKSGGTFTGSVTGTQFKLNNNVTNTNADSFFVYTDGGSTAYGMTLWNTSGTSGEWATMIFGPNQTSRRISFGKANSNFGTSHAGIDELAWLDLDNGNYFTDGSMYPSNQTTHYVSSGRIQNWQTAYSWGNHASAGYLTSSGTIAQANNLQAFDDRDMAPEDLSYSDDLKLFFSAKEGLEDGTSTGSDWHDVLVLNSYSDSSGGNANVLAFDKNSYKIRHYQAGLSASNWGTAKELAYTDNSSMLNSNTTASDVGLGNVTNESKATMFSGAALTNNPTAPTQSAGNNSTRIATTAFVSTAVSNLIDNAPENLNTLNELAEALNDDDDAIVTINTALGNRYTKTESDAKYLLNTTDTFTGIQTIEHSTTAGLIVKNSGTSGQDASIVIRGSRNAPAAGVNPAKLVLQSYDSDAGSGTNVTGGEFYMEATSLTGGGLTDFEVGVRYRKDGSLIDGFNIHDGTFTVNGNIAASNFSGSSSGTNTGDQVSSDFNHDDLTGFVANEHIDWTASQTANIHADNYTNTTYVSSDFTHDDLTGFVANEHIDWTTDQGSTNIHANNYNNTQLSDSQVIAAVVASTNISSEDQGTIRSNIGAGSSSFSGDYDDLTNKPTLLELGTTSTTALAGNTTIPSGNSIIDWTADHASEEIHSGNIIGVGSVLSLPSPANGIEIDSGNTNASAACVPLRLFQNGTSNESIKFVIDGSGSSDAKNKIISDSDDDNAQFAISLMNAAGTEEEGLTVSRGVGVKLGVVNEIGSDTNKFLMVDDQNGNVIEFVTGPNLRSYIGAGTSSFSGAYADLTGKPTTITTAQADAITANTAKTGISSAQSQKLGYITVTQAVDLDTVESNAATAFGWGNHASAGYLTSFDITTQTDSKYIRSNADDTVSAHTEWQDSKQARFGNSADMKIQHTGTHGYIDNNTGDLYIRNNVNADVGGNIYIRPHDNEHGIIVTHDADVKLYYNNSQKMNTTSSGINVTGTVQASGNIGNKGTNIGQTLEYGTSSIATLRCDADRWRVYMGGGGYSHERFSVLESGNVGVGDSTPSYKLDVAGTIRATGDVIAYSDERVKENIKTIDNSLEKVNKLRGVEFNKIGEDKKSIGVIAQEIEKVLPEVVRTDDEGMKSVAYGNVVGVLIEAVKELTKEVEELKKCNKCKNCNCNA